MKSPYRPLAPGVMRSVDPMRVLDETVSRHDVVELLSIDPKFPGAKNVPFRRDIWVLDFQFKPVRMIRVDLPQPSGFMQRKLIWYMVYSVTNTGRSCTRSRTSTFLTRRSTSDSLRGEDRGPPGPVCARVPSGGPPAHERRRRLHQVYPDRVIPAAMDPIRLREDPIGDS